MHASRHLLIKIVLVFIACISLSARHVMSCSCGWDGPFLEVWADADLVVKVKVTSYGPKLEHGENLYESMRVEVLEVIKGEEEKTSLVVYGDPGNLCRPYITPHRFSLGKIYALAIYPIDMDISTSNDGYAISICGENWLSIHDNEISGRIRNDNKETMLYETFLSILKGDE